jgi:FLVCR family MFS transporter
MVESNEQSSLLGHDLGYPSNNTSMESTTRGHFKVYKRRWYVLFVFTAQAFIFNMAWNTWGPIQEPSKVAFGWTDFDLLLLSSWAAIALLATSLPLTWLMDSKGLSFLFLL